MRERRLRGPGHDRPQTGRGQCQHDRDHDRLEQQISQHPWARAADDATGDRHHHGNGRREGAAAHGGDSGHQPADQRRDGQDEDDQPQHEPLGTCRSALDVDRVLTGDQHHHGGIEHEHGECGQRRRRSRPESADQPTGPQHGGQPALEEPLVRRPALFDANHELARGGVAVDSGVVPVRRHGRRLLRVVA